MNTLYKPITFLFLFFIITYGYTQNIHIESKSEKIEIAEDSSFTRNITIKFKKQDESYLYPIFFDSELEEVTDINLYEKKGKRLKQLKVKKIFEEKVELDYIASKKIKSLLIPNNKEIILRYSVKCKELMYLASLHFFSYDNIDTLNYQLNIPKKFELKYTTSYKDSLNFYAVDSTKTNTNAIWNIKVTPKKVEHDPLQYFGIYKNMKVPLMRTIVIPKSYESASLKYMNDWYFNSLKSKSILSYPIKIKIDELTKNVTNKEDIVTILYDYVRKNFKYVAIEVGMGAFIPTPVNEVFSNKQGDCKDLSNFLSQALKYKGIKSDVALASTFDHISNCDFPSLSSANHVICIAYLNNESILLDPTDPIHVPKTPVQSLQNRSILIVNSNGGSFYKVEPFTTEQNKISYELDLQVESEKMLISGNFNIQYFGISDNYLQRSFAYKNENDFKNYITQQFESILGNQTISELEIINKNKKLNFKGRISINGKTFNDGANKYLFIDFLPRLIETETRETLIEGTYLNNPFYKKIRTKIKLDEPIQMFKAKEYSFNENGVSLLFKVKSISKLEIVCEYDFKFNHLFIEKSNIDITNEILKKFKKIINEPIVLKREKI